MGRILLVSRLVLKDLRRRPGQAGMFLLAITAAATALAMGVTLLGATGTLYQKTRQATAGPDVVAVSGSPDGLAQVARSTRVLSHDSPHPVLRTKLTAGGSTVDMTVEGRGTDPGPLDRPRVTSGSWLHPGTVVVERGLATALGIRAGDRVTLAGRTYPVAGVAVTAASPVYPWTSRLSDLGGGPSDAMGLAWLTEKDTRALATPEAPLTYALNLRLKDPAATKAFSDSFRRPGDSFGGSGLQAMFSGWQFIASQDDVLLSNAQPILVIGGWLLGILAMAGLAGLAATRAAQQTRRVGLLKAVGATPGVVATVLLVPYLALALLAGALGLTAAALLVPTVANPSASLLGGPTPPTTGTVTSVAVLALGVTALTVLAPTLRAARTATVPALADTPRPPQLRTGLTALPVRIPTSLLLGLRLTARRPGHAVLHAAGIAVTTIMITALLSFSVQPRRGYDLGGTTLRNLRDDQDWHLYLAVACAFAVLATVNIIVITWTTASEARYSLAIARTLGATPGQVTTGLSLAQLLPALPGAFAGIPLGLGLLWLFTPGEMTVPSASWLCAGALGAVLAVAVLTAVPARTAARLPVARILNSEGA
ncbi:FtsX-like permease family protein [Streptomyces sp. TS71-3]|uniref:FtsX-like permease family protein n=1 Tax=Streptomyces sp. TS71-3 TaxID=2733862 RepID=UPI001B279FA6|nr:FtsX-like permease family protein [Streptomyces sp. TS71-3]GHJ35141.1 hypothetical protein Sm713_07500 [Streptomyces sp. TS71-3]